MQCEEEGSKNNLLPKTASAAEGLANHGSTKLSVSTESSIKSSRYWVEAYESSQSASRNMTGKPVSKEDDQKHNWLTK